MCDFIKNEFGINIKFRSEKFNIEKVCKLVLECFWVKNKVYIFWINQGFDISIVCNKLGILCDIGEVVLIMVLLFWYRVSYVIV